MSAPRRIGGYMPLGSYGVLADGRCSALVALDGRIDWMAAPSLDAPPVFGAILDAEGGGTAGLGPVGDYDVRRRYLPGTPVLESTFTTASGEVQVVDSLNVGNRGMLAWTELVKRIRVTGGSVALEWYVEPGHRFATARPWATVRGGTPMLLVGSEQVAVVTEGLGEPVVGNGSVRGGVVLHDGEEALLAMVLTDAEPLPVPHVQDISERLELTISRWQRWCDLLDYEGPYLEAVRRSALVLAGLTYMPSAAITAAPTTSLPERLGGSRNYDYRYAWVRDGSFALDALSKLGMTEEVHASISWLLSAVGRSAPDINVMYTLSGDPAPADARVVEGVPGYRGSYPVVRGNPASAQRQLGAYGDLFDAVWRYTRHGGHLDTETGFRLSKMADKVCDLWHLPDAGIWELDEMRQYTISKIGCWVALDRAVNLSEADELPGLHLERWRETALEVHRWTDAECWSERESSYSFYAGSDELDASVLLAARTGFLAPADPRLASTIDAIGRRLRAKGPLLYRYSGTSSQEGAFVACSFWMVEALAICGRREEARQMLDDMLGWSNDLGLFSEEIDPGSGDLLGNLPLGLSHLALIGAVTSLGSADA